MKKFSILVLSTLIALCAFNSCSSDDDDDDKIVGKWKVTAASLDIKSNNADFDAEMKEEFEEDKDRGIGTTIEFKSNGEVWYGEYYDNEKYKFEKGKLVIYDVNYPDDDEYMDYSLKGDNLTLTYDEKEEYQEDADDYDEDIKVQKANVVVQYTRVK